MNLYFDAAPNKWEKVVNSFGKKISGSNGFRYAIVDDTGKLLETGYNTKANFQIEGEAYALLKTIEYIKNNIHEPIELNIYGDNETVIGIKFKSKTSAGKYCYIADKIIQELESKGFTINLLLCESKDNKADKASRYITELKKR